MKLSKILTILLCLVLSSCAELQQVVNQLPQGGGVLSEAQIGDGLKQALQFGIDKQVSKLTQTDGFLGNALVKIAIPEELKVVEDGLRKIGLGNLADEGVKALNRAAEDAVKEATPIFIDAVSGISFADAKNILLGADNAATTYLQSRTTSPLYNKFHPVIKNSFGKVGADAIWENLIHKYNTIPFVKQVNPDLTQYVTNKALDGVFTMIAVEEKEIRNKVGARTTNLLRQVFALQDNK
ncbi:MAG: DUF4197 domain-containing protein [Flavobacteriaceae bacterium]|nr:DUF4197 domain-containing protein [Flavobacteriaceae bacterium]